jgi:hypothetical protein
MRSQWLSDVPNPKLDIGPYFGLGTSDWHGTARINL